MACCTYCNGMLTEVCECGLCHKVFCSFHEAPESHNCEALEIKISVQPEKKQEEQE